jgi:apolipoprotein N-acyltransferase
MKGSSAGGIPSALVDRPSISERLASLARHETLRWAVLGGLLVWAALPPLGGRWFGWIGWLAPVPWLWLARLPALPGRRPYWALWIGGAVFWLATNHWLLKPHPATSVGWLALSLYLAAFTPLMVGLARVAARIGVGIVVAGPVLWVAADEARAYMWTGFSMSSLVHSQVEYLPLIQCADLCGEFGVTLLMVAAGAAIARSLPLVRGGSWSPRWLVVGATIVGGMAAYGFVRINEIEDGDRRIKIALVQGSIDSQLESDVDRRPMIFQTYLKLSKEALSADPSAQLVVWPETMFPYPYSLWTEDFTFQFPDGTGPDKIREVAEANLDLIRYTARSELKRPMLLGLPAAEFEGDQMRSYNSALFVSADGKPRVRYDKQHRVIFGEFTPLADVIPFLRHLTPLTGGVEAGTEPKSFEVAGVRLAPNICYETTLARVIRRQMVELGAKGEEPDVLVNVTNDGWFYGSSELDLHLACGVFRAIECRKPLVIAANTGFSAYIDARGRMVWQGPRRAEATYTADAFRSVRRLAVANLRGGRIRSGGAGVSATATRPGRGGTVTVCRRWAFGGGGRVLRASVVPVDCRIPELPLLLEGVATSYRLA